MSQADGASATIKSNDNIGLQVEAVAGGWREGVAVLVMVLAPIALAVFLLATGVLAIAAWQMMRIKSNRNDMRSLTRWPLPDRPRPDCR